MPDALNLPSRLKRVYKGSRYSKEWQSIRKSKLEACNYKCECEGGCDQRATQVHHLRYSDKGSNPYKDVPLQDLQALCRWCHMAVGDRVSVLEFPDCCKSLPR